MVQSVPRNWTGRSLKHSLRTSTTRYGPSSNRSRDKTSPILARKERPSSLHRMRYPARFEDDFLGSPVCCGGIACL